VFGQCLLHLCLQKAIGKTAIYRSLISLSLLFTLLTVVLSAYIRLAEVGVGCEGWPDCYAQLNPAVEKKGVTVLTAEGRDMGHYAARVAHRYIASILGLFILGIFIVSLRQGKSRSTTVLVPVGIMAITIFLSLLGYYTPSRSNPLITMGNLLGGMSLLGLLWWLMQREAGGIEPPREASSHRPLARMALCLVFIQVILGGWSSANYASASCPGLVHCQGEVLTAGNAADVFSPGRSIELDEGGQVVRTDGLGLLSMAHRLFALFTAAYLARMVRRLKHEPQLKGTLLAVSAFSISQIVVGVSTIWLSVPLLLLTLHNSLAACLLLACINLLHRLSPATGSGPPG
jgi:cytochrome c oxidase assembly protein subunit 15